MLAAESEKAGCGQRRQSEDSGVRLDQEPELPRCSVPRPRGMAQLPPRALCTLRLRPLGGLDALILPVHKGPRGDLGARVCPGLAPCSATYSVGLWVEQGTGEDGQVSRGRGGGGRGGADTIPGVPCRGMTFTEVHGGPASTPNLIFATKFNLRNDPSWKVLSAILYRRGNQGTERGGQPPEPHSQEGGGLAPGPILSSRSSS